MTADLISIEKCFLSFTANYYHYAMYKNKNGEQKMQINNGKIVQQQSNLQAH